MGSFEMIKMDFSLTNFMHVRVNRITAGEQKDRKTER
jgi:hypothetical protein